MSKMNALLFSLIIGPALAIPLTSSGLVSRQSDGGDPLRGPSNLLGYAPTNQLTNENTADVEKELAPGQDQDANLGLYLDFSDIDSPQPIRGSRGGTDPGPRNSVLDKMNPDKLAPPGTDKGQTINAQWPMGLSHVKMGIQNAGWSRQQNTNVMPDATAMAGVDMRLEAGAYRELHWHVASEWALMLNGTVRIQAMNENGENFIDDVSKGDVWFFPAGVPHSIQALGGGAEFMLVFDDGDFSEDNTFLASEIFAHNPKSVLSKNLNVPVEAFDNIPDGELFIFPGTPAPQDINAQKLEGSAGMIPQNETYSYHFSEQAPLKVPGGSVKIVDPVTFPIAKNFAAALVTVDPGAMREIHWHPSSPEWNFFLAGKARATLFTPPNEATTFDYQAGDVGYFPISESHYIENVGDEELVFLEVLQASKFTDIALGQWLGLVPPQIVKDTLKLSDETVAKFSKEKKLIMPGNNTEAPEAEAARKN